MKIILFLLLLPFLQIGFSYFLSIGTLNGLLALSIVRKSLLASLRNYDFIAVFLIIFVLIASLFNEANGMTAFVRAARESIIFLPMALYGNIKFRLVKMNLGRVMSLLLFICVAMLFLSLVQLYFIKRTMYFGLPIEWFSRNAGSLPGYLDLLYSDIRPMGTFGEPSYLSYIMFSIMVIVSPLIFKKNRQACAIFLAAILVILLSRSGLGFLLAGALVAYLLAKKNLMFGIYAGVTVLILLVVFSEYIPVFERFSNIFTSASTKSSGFGRIYVPMMVLPDFIASNPLGISRTNVDPNAFVGTFPVKWGQIRDNGLFNTIFSYGIFGIAMLLYLYIKNSYSVIMIIFLSSTLLQGGDPWSFDKLSVFLMTKYLYAYCSEVERNSMKASHINKVSVRKE